MGGGLNPGGLGQSERFNNTENESLSAEKQEYKFPDGSTSSIEPLERVSDGDTGTNFSHTFSGLSGYDLYKLEFFGIETSNTIGQLALTINNNTTANYEYQWVLNGGGAKTLGDSSIPIARVAGGHVQGEAWVTGREFVSSSVTNAGSPRVWASHGYANAMGVAGTLNADELPVTELNVSTASNAAFAVGIYGVIVP